jgi:sec-independent protein translocase protein TatC
MNDPRDRRERLLIEGFKIFMVLFVAFALGAVVGRMFTLAYIDQFPESTLGARIGTILVGERSAGALNRISFASGLVFEIPAVIHLLGRRRGDGVKSAFVAPAMSVLLFIAGAMFAWFVVLNFTLGFLTSFSPDDIRTELSTSSFADFVSRIVVAVGVTFQIPLVMDPLARYGALHARTFRRLRRYAIVIVAAVITPTPDPFTQLTVAIPMYGLYELGILLARRAAPDDDPTAA